MISLDALIDTLQYIVLVLLPLCAVAVTRIEREWRAQHEEQHAQEAS